MRKRGGFAAFVTAIFAGAALCAALCPPAWAVDKKQALDEKLMDRIRAIEAGLDGVLGLAVKDLKTGKTYLINENEVFPQASSIKIALLFEVFKQAEEGKLRLEEFVDLEPGKKVAGSGVLFYMGNPRLSLSVRDLCVLMIVLSDNTATNLLIEKAGMEAVNRRMDALELTKTRLRRKMMDLTAAAEGRENVSTPAEMMALLEKVQRGQVLKDPYRRELIDILAIPKESPLKESPLHAGIPEDVVVAEKTGELEAVRCDSGIVHLKDRPYIICVMTTYLKNDADGNPAIAAVAKLVYEHFSRLQRSSEYGRVVSEK
jgi:beta-lactamase class A